MEPQNTQTSQQRHYNMSRIRGKNTSPELKVRKWLHSQGFRFRVNAKRLPGTPDIVLAKYRTCIFVNGCFWHGHNGCRSYSHPKTNAQFWEEKVRRNKLRDEVVCAKLEALRWNVVTIWECQLKKDAIGNSMEQLAATLVSNREKWLQELEKRRNDRERAKAEKTARNARKEALAADLNIPDRIKRLSEQED